MKGEAKYVYAYSGEMGTRTKESVIIYCGELANYVDWYACGY